MKYKFLALLLLPMAAMAQQAMPTFTPEQMQMFDKFLQSPATQQAISSQIKASGVNVQAAASGATKFDPATVQALLQSFTPAENAATASFAGTATGQSISGKLAALPSDGLNVTAQERLALFLGSFAAAQSNGAGAMLTQQNIQMAAELMKMPGVQSILAQQVGAANVPALNDNMGIGMGLMKSLTDPELQAIQSFGATPEGQGIGTKFTNILRAPAAGQ